VIFLVYDLTNPESFENIATWLERAQNNPVVKMALPVLVGTKFDISSRTKITPDKISELCQKLQISLAFEISSVTGYNIFHAVAHPCLHVIRQIHEKNPDTFTWHFADEEITFFNAISHFFDSQNSFYIFLILRFPQLRTLFSTMPADLRGVLFKVYLTVVLAEKFDT
jgi:GTPase SAR1 family protein